MSWADDVKQKFKDVKENLSDRVAFGTKKYKQAIQDADQEKPEDKQDGWKKKVNES